MAIKLSSFEMGQLEPGAVFLRVPVANDAVQMNADFSECQTGILQVRAEGAKEAELVTIRRVDKPYVLLQVEKFSSINGNAMVFGDPIGKLILNRQDEIWVAQQPELVVQDLDDFDDFVNIVGYYASSRQLKQKNQF